MRAKLEEAQLTTRLRRLKMTSMLADQLGAQSLRELQAETLDTKKAGLVLREHLDYAKAERELFGDDRRSERSPERSLHVYLGAPNNPAPLVGGSDPMVVAGFRDFMKGYDPTLAATPIDPDAAKRVIGGETEPNAAPSRLPL